MDILKIFNLYDKDYNINIIGTVEEPLFQANQIAKLLDIKNIHTTIKDFDDDEKIVDIYAMDTRNRRQKTTFITELGLYRLLGMSRKEEARKFQKWICSVMKEITLNGKFELDANKESDKELIERRVELEKHKTLIESFHNKSIIYITVLDNYRNINDTNNSIYKIGFSDNFAKRFKQLEKTYGPVTVLHIFEINCNREFEKFLFKHEFIESKRYKDNIVDQKTREVFSMSKEDLNNVLDIIKHNSQNFSSYEIIEMKKKLERNKAILESNKTKLEMMKLQKEVDNVSAISPVSPMSPMSHMSPTSPTSPTSSTSHMSSEDFNEVIPSKKPEYNWVPGDTLFDVVKRNNSRSPNIQKYDPNTLELIETFDSIIDVTRQYGNLSYSGLKTAAKNKTIYKDYRWHIVDKKEADVKYDIGETKMIRNNTPNAFIAMIDIKKEKILEVYASQKDASDARNFTNGAAISKAVSQYSLSSGHYWKKYDDCSDELKATFNRPLPERNVSNICISINILHKTTKEVVKTYSSVIDVIKDFQLSRITLNKICKNKTVYKNFLFEIVK